MNVSKLILALCAGCLAAACLLQWWPASANFEREGFTVEGGPAQLAAELHLPRRGGPHAALVLVPGAGPALHDEPWFRAHAERLASAGFAVLTYDKRGSGGSSGNGVGASLRELAQDVAAAVAALRADERVDPRRIGLIGLSQGGAVALLALQEDPSLACLAAISFSPYSPAQQVTATLEHLLFEAGFDEQVQARAHALAKDALDAMRSGQGLDAARAALAAEENRAWLEDVHIPPLCDPSFAWGAFRHLPMDFDPLAALLACPAPVFIAQGAQDDLVPGTWAAASLEEFARRRGLDVDVHLFEGAGHGLRVQDGVRIDWQQGWLEEDWRWPEAYWAALEGWLLQRAFTD